MTAIKPHDGTAFVSNGGRGLPLVLIYGPDQGAVSEQANTLQISIAAASAEPPTVVNLTSENLAADPGRLADEAGASSLFGGDPLIRLRVTDGRHNILPAIKAMIDDPPAGARIIVEGGDLKPSSGLRKAFESAGNAAALPCYEPTSDEIAKLVKTLMAEAGKTITDEAVALLTASLGADRRASRNEIEKLILYAGKGPAEITGRDIRALIGESAELRNDRLIDNALCGRPADVEADFMRLRMERASASGLLAQALRQVIDLQAMRTAFDTGSAPATVMARQRPPVFFKRRGPVEQAIRAWPVADLSRARTLIAEAILKCRKQPALDGAFAADVLMKIAVQGNRRKGRGSQSR